MGTTLQEQLDWLNEARKADADLGFRGRMLALCSLRWTGQGKRSHFARTNGTFTLAMSAVGNTRFPCGNLPRPLLAWVCTQAVRTGRRVLALRKGFRGFMARPGIHATDGYGRPRLRDQRERLLSSAISLHCRGDCKSVRLARAERLNRAMAAHSPSHAAADPRRARVRCLRLSVRLMTLPSCSASLKVTAGPPAFPNRLPAPSLTRAFGCLRSLAWRLIRWVGASQPPER